MFFCILALDSFNNLNLPFSFQYMSINISVIFPKVKIFIYTCLLEENNLFSLKLGASLMQWKFDRIVGLATQADLIFTTSLCYPRYLCFIHESHTNIPKVRTQFMTSKMMLLLKFYWVYSYILDKHNVHIIISNLYFYLIYLDPSLLFPFPYLAFSPSSHPYLQKLYPFFLLEGREKENQFQGDAF